jgi:hypothetical protein
MAYSDRTGEQPVPVGTSLKFPSATKYLVATVELVGLMRSSLGPEVSIPLNDTIPAKRPCVRPLGVGGSRRKSARTNQNVRPHTSWI